MQTKFYSKRDDKYKWILLAISLVLGAFLIYFALDNEGEEQDRLPNYEGLPVIVIDSFGEDLAPNVEELEKEIDGRTMRLYTSSQRYDGNFKLYMEDPFKSLASKAEPLVESDIVINARGQSSLRYPKKQYTIRLEDEAGFENPQGLWTRY